MKKEKDWFKDRGYPHFSNKTSKSIRKNILRYVSNPKLVTKHSFLPLIFKEIKQRRYKMSNFNGIIRHSHKKLKKGKMISNTKIREIMYATHIDAHLFSYYTQKIITPKYETYLKQTPQLSDCISAYRRIKTKDKLKYKNNVHFSKDIFDEIKRRENCVALVFDIENFFPSLNHKKLKLAWAKILGYKSLPKDHYNLFKATTNFSYVKLKDLKYNKKNFDEKKIAQLKKEGKHTFFNNIQELIGSDIIIHKNQKKSNGKLVGIPQGLPISALLANIYMLSFDESILTKLVNKENVFYRRYSDDIIILCKKEQIEHVEDIFLNEIKKIELSVSLDKTEKTLFKINDNRLQSYRIIDDKLKFNLPLNYLGFEFYGYQTLIKSKNIAQFYREMKQSIKIKDKRVKSLKEKFLIDELSIFKRKIYRLYSFKGVKKREIPAKKTLYKNGKIKTIKYYRKFRGNYLKYVYNASDELEAPEIKRQLRNHWKILQKTMKKYNFSNVDKE